MSAPRIPTEEENPNGLHQRYKVTYADGSPVDEDALHFVLRLDAGGEDAAHIRACRAAARAYAEAVVCDDDNHSLSLFTVARELMNLVRALDGGDGPDCMLVS